MAERRILFGFVLFRFGFSLFFDWVWVLIAFLLVCLGFVWAFAKHKQQEILLGRKFCRPNISKASLAGQTGLREAKPVLKRSKVVFKGMFTLMMMGSSFLFFHQKQE